jgi:sugar (pentulose or hexulose) kinase
MKFLLARKNLGFNLGTQNIKGNAFDNQFESIGKAAWST